MAVNYTEKVMKHMQNPHNVGDIENADGVGRVGNPVCVTPSELIHANDELKEITCLSVGEVVLGNDGRYHTILHKSSRRYKGKLVVVKNKLGSTGLTPEHMVLAAKVPKKQKYLRIAHKKRLVSDASWFHAEELKVGDLILYPVLKEVKDIKKIPLIVNKPKYDFKSKDLPKEIAVTSSFLRLTGYYLAEGFARQQKSRTYLSFTFNINEEAYAKDVARIVKSLFGLSAKLEYKPSRNTLTVLVYSAPLTRFFKELFGSGARKKRIPHFMVLLPLRKQKSLIEGLWRGDGYVSKNRRWPRAGYTTISLQLAHQLKILLLRQGIIPAMYVEEEKERKGVVHQEAYRIHVGDRESMKKLAKILGIQLKFIERTQIKAWMDEDYLYTPITKIEELDYAGMVHNLEVEQTHSFLSKSLCLHNCGDVMSLSIKVENNIITDAKFKTYGCGAAIATSSMLTDLVKGKTIEEAEKITKDELAKGLGGLPPIKMHCSMLAVDALHSAIKDYKGKHK